MNANYQSASLIVRNIADITGFKTCEHVRPGWRIFRLGAPFFQGSEFWVVNDKGFFWEPVDSKEAGIRFIEKQK